MDETPDRNQQGLPGEESNQNNEEPSHPAGGAERRPNAGRADGGDGDPDSGGESREGSQSTGSPGAAG